MFETDVKNMPFDWVDSSARALQTLVNCSLVMQATTLMASKPFDKIAEMIFKSIPVRPSKKDEKELLERTLQLLGRMIRAPEGLLKIMQSKNIILKLLVYYSYEDTNKSALIALHALCGKGEIFREMMLETHGLPPNSFDKFLTTGMANFNKAKEESAWDDYVNVCASLTAFVGAFPERAEEL